MIFSTALVSLLLTVVIVEGSVCVPPEDDSEYELEADSDSSSQGYEEIRKEAESAILTESGSVISDLSGGDDCSVIGESTSDAAVRRNTILPWLKTCEPCPPTVGYLHRFLNYCYIIQRPFYQWIRFVSCPTYCSQPCWCSNSRCVKTNYKLVWVWAYCTQDTGYGFKYGLNFRWLWLPQDCQCKEFLQIG